MHVTTADATVGIVDDRISMTADGDVAIYLTTPDHTPLSESERHATLKITGEDYRATVDLNATQLDALADALNEATEADSDD